MNCNIAHFCFLTGVPDDSRWQTVTRTNNGLLEEFTVSYQNLLPSTSYTFRVIAYNKYGISYPAYSDDAVNTLTWVMFHGLTKHDCRCIQPIHLSVRSQKAHCTLRTEAADWFTVLLCPDQEMFPEFPPDVGILLTVICHVLRHKV
jgi:hypothetical protein